MSSVAFRIKPWAKMLECSIGVKGAIGGGAGVGAAGHDLAQV